MKVIPPKVKGKPKIRASGTLPNGSTVVINDNGTVFQGEIDQLLELLPRRARARRVVGVAEEDDVRAGRAGDVREEVVLRAARHVHDVVKLA